LGGTSTATHDDTAQTRLDKLDAVLARSFTPPQDAPLIAEMLSLPNDGRYPALQLTPQERRQKTLATLTAQIEALSRSNPVLMIFEDVHWFDPTSLEALGRMVERLRTLGLLLIVTHRPEFEAPWTGRPYVTALNLNRLGEREIAALIDCVTGNDLLPKSVRQDIIERTDGIPLFVEEMTKAVMEAESEGDARRTAATVSFSALVVPASLHASLMARLDRLGAAKAIAQIGAAIGREFSHPLIAAVAGKPEQELQSALDRIITAGLLFRHGMPSHASYLFKHALVQDAAYGSLLREPRRALHARIAETLETQFQKIAENQPELLARHYTEAGIVEKAATLWGEAGLRSIERSALVEAVEQLSRGLTQIATLAGTPAMRHEQMKMQVALTNTLFHVKGFAAPQTKAAAEQARLLIEQARAFGERFENPLLVFSVLYSSWAASYTEFNGDAMRELAVQFMSLAKDQEASIPIMVGHRLMGTSLMETGEIAQGRAHYDQAIALYDPTKHRSLGSQFGQDVRIAALGYRARTLWMLGYPDAGLADARKGLAEAREVGRAHDFMFALGLTAWVNLLCGDYIAGKAQFDEVVTFANEKGSQFALAAATLAQGWLLALTGQASSAVTMLNSGIGALRSTGATPGPWYLSYLARAHAELGQFDDAWRWITEASTIVEITKEKWVEAEVHRMSGEIALLSLKPNTAKADAHFQRALAVAGQQQAKSWELRAAMSLARLWRDQGKVQQARELLAPVYGWFTEGHSTRDLKEAKALLEEMAT
jgi:predicted ATPase